MGTDPEFAKLRWAAGELYPKSSPRRDASLADLRTCSKRQVWLPKKLAKEQGSPSGESTLSKGLRGCWGFSVHNSACSLVVSISVTQQGQASHVAGTARHRSQLLKTRHSHQDCICMSILPWSGMVPGTIFPQGCPSLSWILLSQKSPRQGGLTRWDSRATCHFGSRVAGGTNYVAAADS